MKKLIPTTTNPPSASLARVHEPEVANRKGGYGAYRPCLRWEFGFTCAFCLLHESDLNEFGLAEGWAVTSIEHRETQKSSSDKANTYKNCYYACRFCNASRSTKPLTDNEGTKLLDPCGDVWSEHFLAENYSLTPKTKEGEYTRTVFDVNDATRVRIREKRSDNITRWRELILNRPKDIQRLLTVAQKYLQSSKFDERATGQNMAKLARDLQSDVNRARLAIERYLAIPADHDPKCRCSNVTLKLPNEIEKQLVEFPT